MQIRNIGSGVSLEINYGNDFCFTGNDKINRLFYEPVVIRGRLGGSYLETFSLGRDVWDAISRICYDKDPEQKGSIEQLRGIYEINGDKNDPNETTKIRSGMNEAGELSLSLISLEDAHTEKIKKLELAISRTREQAAGILIVSERQFQQFLELALSIQSFAGAK